MVDKENNRGNRVNGMLGIDILEAAVCMACKQLCRCGRKKL